MAKSKRTPAMEAKFLTAIREGATVADACRENKLHRRTVYVWRKNYPKFAKAWEEAIETSVERLEAEADRRAVDGVLEPVFYQGKECGKVRKFSDTLLIFRLKALRPDKYRERYETTGAGGGPVEVVKRVIIDVNVEKVGTVSDQSKNS